MNLGPSLARESDLHGIDEEIQGSELVLLRQDADVVGLAGSVELGERVIEYYY
jgi:hypothetical protein